MLLSWLLELCLELERGAVELGFEEFLPFIKLKMPTTVAVLRLSMAATPLVWLDSDASNWLWVLSDCSTATVLIEDCGVLTDGFAPLL